MPRSDWFRSTPSGPITIWTRSNPSGESATCPMTSPMASSSLTSSKLSVSCTFIPLSDFRVIDSGIFLGIFLFFSRGILEFDFKILLLFELEFLGFVSTFEILCRSFNNGPCHLASRCRTFSLFFFFVFCHEKSQFIFQKK